MPNSDDLHLFNVLTKSETLAECARKLDATPPAVTKRLRVLEERIGVRLIDRVGRKITLTEEGPLVASHGAPSLPGGARERRGRDAVTLSSHSFPAGTRRQTM
jgi:DNA-binding transcriptional LysR family regulator